MQPSDDLHLANIPPDIVRQIVKAVPKKFRYSLRQVSCKQSRLIILCIVKVWFD